ncbi:MAG: alpha/beta fold hydrolase [Spirochaetaceae bacterium]|nr:MAG: alpha/beta fold hydrolase [Spirochaetaceae bacterium]
MQLEKSTYKIGKEEYIADCGTLIVPENRSNPDSRLIALPVTRIRSTQNNPAEPIFFLEGGPGSSNMHAEPLSAMLENHDFVMVGYRGLDGSVSLDCPEVTQAMKGDGGNVLSESSLDRLSVALCLSAARLQAEGVDLDGYTIREVAEDLEAARRGLGYGKVNLLSQSYGTRVAQYLTNLYPGSIHRSVMVSVNPPGHFVWEPDVIDSQIGYYSRLYARTENPRSLDLAQTMREVSRNMPESWLFFRIDPGKVKIVTFALLFHRSSATQVFDTWLMAAEGDPSGLAIMSLAYDFVIPRMKVWGEFFSKGISVDYDPSRDYAAEMDRPNSIIGSPMSKLVWGGATDADGCAWPIALLPAEYHRVQPSAVETLLVSGSIDVSTPAEFATEELLPMLSNGRQVILSEMGHVGDVMTRQPEAIERLLVQYYDTGEVDDSLFVYEAMDFHVKLGYPALAKILVAVVAVLTIAVVWAVWVVIRRRRHSE